ncbi:hypothetical protein CU254_21685 [Amycolatopsis sp. AA4]|uniref:hypothetical protein n=1 Tax=Actinomycetes TaxID=1760 RepID=UPI0001B5706B|nr:MULTISPECIES: hypothetical protein [Actinomycetes]ATY12778.1 hypothetical protein CU254_21685 [Amycolatopsis sp. AA4]
MRTHCLSFCTALRRHHVGEDSTVFPSLAEQFPAPAPVLAQHQTAARLRTKLERLAGELEAHFALEEPAVVTALNATAAAPPTA